MLAWLVQITIVQVFAAGGGQHGGGGTTPISTATEVISAIKSVRDDLIYLLKPMGDGWPYAQLKKNLVLERAYHYTTDERLRSIFKTILEKKDDRDSDDVGTVYFLKRSKIVIKNFDQSSVVHEFEIMLKYPSLKEYATVENAVSPLKIDGDCDKMGDEDAYVSKFEVGADICFNVERLRRHSPHSLFKEIFSLMMHEMTHLAGYGEPEAKSVWLFFAKNFDRIKYIEGFTERVDSQLRDSIRLIQSSRMYLSSGNFVEASQRLSYSLGLLDSIDALSPDFLFANHQEYVARPELADSIKTQREKILIAIGNLTHEFNSPQISALSKRMDDRYEEIVKDLFIHRSDSHLFLTGRRP